MQRPLQHVRFVPRSSEVDYFDKGRSEGALGNVTAGIA